MLLRLYAILVTLLLLLALFAPESSQLLPHLKASKLVGNGQTFYDLNQPECTTPPPNPPPAAQTTIYFSESTFSEVNSSESLELEQQGYADALKASIENAAILQLQNVQKSLSLTPVQSEIALDYFRKQERTLQLYDILGPIEAERQLKELGTLDDALGMKVEVEVQAVQELEMQKQTLQIAEEEVAYLTETVSLTPEQEAKLLSALLEPWPERSRRSQEAHLNRRLKLNSEQRKTLRFALEDSAKQTEAIIMGVTDPAELSTIDASKIANSIILEYMKPHLTEEQFQQLLSYQAERYY